jgi:hypothetical protein
MRDTAWLLLEGRTRVASGVPFSHATNKQITMAGELHPLLAERANRRLCYVASKQAAARCMTAGCHHRGSSLVAIVAYRCAGGTWPPVANTQALLRRGSCCSNSGTTHGCKHTSRQKTSRPANTRCERGRTTAVRGTDAPAAGSVARARDVPAGRQRAGVLESHAAALHEAKLQAR